MANTIIIKTDEKTCFIALVFVRFGDKLIGDGMKKFYWGSLFLTMLKMLNRVK